MGGVAVHVDDKPPQWSPDARMFADRIEAHQVRLAWSNAIDDTGVVLYRIYIDGAEIARCCPDKPTMVSDHSVVLNIPSVF